MNIREHPRYTDDNYAYMVSRGYTDEQIADYWTSEAYRVAARARKSVARPANTSLIRCRECGAPGAVNATGLGISCGCAAE